MAPRFKWAITYVIPAIFVALSASVTMAAGVAVAGTELRDNGDDDGFADTYETVSLRLTVRNTTFIGLRKVVLNLSTDAPEIACISRSRVFVGDLAAGEAKTTEEAFVFTVAGVDRGQLGLGPFDDWRVSFDVSVDTTLGDGSSTSRVSAGMTRSS